MTKVRYAISDTIIDFTGLPYKADGQLLGDVWVWRLQGSHFEPLPVGVELLPPHSTGAHRLKPEHKAKLKKAVAQPGDSLWDMIAEHSEKTGNNFHEHLHP